MSGYSCFLLHLLEFFFFQLPPLPPSPWGLNPDNIFWFMCPVFWAMGK